MPLASAPRELFSVSRQFRKRCRFVLGGKPDAVGQLAVKEDRLILRPTN